MLTQGCFSTWIPRQNSPGSSDACAFEEPFYRHIDKTGLRLSTKLSMGVSDWFCMVKMVHVKANAGIAPAKG